MAITRFGSMLWWRKWAKRDWAIAGLGFTIIVFILSFFFDVQDTNNKNNTIVPDLSPYDDLVDLTLLHSAKDRGAFCLDGSLPGYHFQRGFGSGSRNWVLHIEGGGWCNTVESCSLRTRTALGSSKYMDRQFRFTGILSHEASHNPDFYNWNKVKIRYCDGASLAGHPEREFKNGTKLFFRGQLIWEVLMDELLSLGLSNADQALLSGCSAGGLASLIHCDGFREIMPKNAAVKCLADAGFFLDENDVLGNRTMGSFFHDVVQLQGVVKSLDKNCVAGMESSRCLFPREIFKSMKTPGFIVNPAYDFWQIQHILVPDESDPSGSWRKCRLNINSCSPSQINTLQGQRHPQLPPYKLTWIVLMKTNLNGTDTLRELEFGHWSMGILPLFAGTLGSVLLMVCLSLCGVSYLKFLYSFPHLYIVNAPNYPSLLCIDYRNSLLKGLSNFQQNKDGGMFIDSCFSHCQTLMTETWHSPNSPRINDKTIAESVGDWYFNKKDVKQIDCPYPCNPTCHNVDFS